jgi:hypothetical protein
MRKEPRMAKPFKRPHSHAPAAMRTKVKPAKGSAVSANKAGNNNANNTRAVMTRCFNM